jgi:hypothetical protein
VTREGHQRTAIDSVMPSVSANVPSKATVDGWTSSADPVHRGDKMPIGVVVKMAIFDHGRPPYVGPHQVPPTSHTKDDLQDQPTAHRHECMIIHALTAAS